MTSEQASSQTLLFNLIPGAVKGVRWVSANGIASCTCTPFFSRLCTLLLRSCWVTVRTTKSASNNGINTSLAGTYIYNWSVEVAQGGIVSLLASNSQGRTKTTFSSAVVVEAEGLGNVIDPLVIFKNADRLAQG